MRLIDADALKAKLSNNIDEVIWEIYHAPNVEAEPVRHGKWIKNENGRGWRCSCCDKDDFYAYSYNENSEVELQDFYCPNCGAKMFATNLQPICNKGDEHR